MDIAIISLTYAAEIMHGETYGKTVIDKDGVVD